MGEAKRRATATATGGDWSTVRFNSGACLNCGQPLTGITGPVTGPVEGSLMVCGDCGYVMEWDGEKNVELSAETMAEASQDPEVDKILAVTRVLRDLPFTPQRVIMLEDREPEICEDCGKLDECRPYGHRKPDGKRKWVCFPCAKKDEAELSRAIDERMEGENPV